MRPWLLSAEGKRKGLYARIEKPDFECAIGDRASLPDNLIEPLLIDGTVARGIDIRAVVFAGRRTVDCHTKLDRLCAWRRPQPQMHIARMKPIHNRAILRVEVCVFSAYCPVTGQRPF